MMDFRDLFDHLRSRSGVSFFIYKSPCPPIPMSSPFFPAAALLLDLAIQRAGACLCVEMAEILKMFTQQQTDNPADTQVQKWQRKHARLGYSYGPYFLRTVRFSLVYPAFTKKSSHFKPNSSILSALEVYII